MPISGWRCPLWDVWKELRDGGRVRLLPAYTPPAYPINAVCSSRRLTPDPDIHQAPAAAVWPRPVLE